MRSRSTSTRSAWSCAARASRRRCARGDPRSGIERLSERNNTILRLALFAVGLAAVAAVAAFAGRASGIEVEEAPVDAMAHGAESGGDTANGLSDTASGFRFRLDTGALRAALPRA